MAQDTDQTLHITIIGTAGIAHAFGGAITTERASAAAVNNIVSPARSRAETVLRQSPSHT